MGVSAPKPLRRRLLFVAAVGALPVAIAAGIALWALVQVQWRDAEAKSLEVARLAAAAIDVELQKTTATLRALAGAPQIEQGDFAGYEVMLARDIAQMPQWRSVVLHDLEGRPVAHAGASVSRQVDPVSFGYLLQVGHPVVGRLVRDGDHWALPVRVPVERNDRLLYVLTAMLSPDGFVEVVEKQALPPDWILSLFDQEGARIARSRDQARYLGTSAAPSLQDLIATGAPHGTGITRTLEGTEVYTAFVRTPDTRWVTAIGIPTQSVQASVWRAFAIYGGGMLASIIAAILLASLATQRITRPLAALGLAASRIGRGEALETPATDIRELAQLGESLAAAVAGRERLEADRRSMLAELRAARDDLKQQVADLQRLHRLGNDVLRLPDLDSQLSAILAALCELHGTQKGLVSLQTPQGQLRTHAAIGFSPSSLERLREIGPGDGACGTALRDDCRVLVEDTETDPVFAPFRDLARTERFRAVHSTPIRGTHGRVIGVLSVHALLPGRPSERQMRLSDLCTQLCTVLIERTAAQTDAAELERRLKVALDSSTVPFSVLAPVRDRSGVIVDFVWEHLNRAAAVDIGRDVEALVGKPVGKVAPSMWSIPGLFEGYVAVAATDRGREFEVTAAEGDPPRCLQIVATPFEGRVAVWSADVTQRKEQERALQAADRRKDEFLAVLAHELRNPLAPIQQAAMIASAEGATEAQQRWSQDVIARQVRHMALLLDDLLDVSRITRGKLELRKSRIELRSVVDAALETARPHLVAKAHRLVLELPEVPIHLHADPLRVAQVVTNLLTNAARYTDAGGVIRLAGGVEHGQAWVSVEDNGIGIPPEQIDSIFEMFAQGRGRQAQGGGLGIGLALSRGIAQLHGGVLSAASRGAGLGSKFTLRLPLGEAMAAAPSQTVAPAGPLRPLRILVADDNRDAADTLASLLRLSGHETEIAYDGPAALRDYERRRPEVVFLDIGMPSLSGYEVAQRIRALDPAGPRPLLVALTGWGQSKDKASAANAGFDHHLTKPVDVRQLFEILRGRTETMREPLRAVR